MTYDFTHVWGLRNKTNKERKDWEKETSQETDS